jgi:hypothetical protein
MKVPASVLFVFCIYLPVNAQENNATEKYAPAIEDNSFFMEEAYNQEERVVQHISNVYYRTNPTKDVIYSFTQEWPLFKYKQQISYTIPFSFLDGNSSRGIGDIMINYRYQVFYKENWACFAPRLSLILPTGVYLKSLGYNTFGFQLNLPVSKRLSDFWVVHLNGGYTLLPNAENRTTENESIRKTLSFYNIGGSVIWLTNKSFNLMLECVENLNSNIGKNKEVQYVSVAIINPGIRAAINLGDLQIVPGLSVPFFITNQEINPAILFYLSFEHPY